MAGLNLPDDANQCRCCGVPIHWPMTFCDDCEPHRDARGRFAKRPTVTGEERVPLDTWAPTRVELLVGEEVW